jgi:hypothetical protein
LGLGLGLGRAVEHLVDDALYHLRGVGRRGDDAQAPLVRVRVRVRVRARVRVRVSLTLTLTLTKKFQ